MKFVFHTNSISPHQIPLAKELVRRFGATNYRYVFTTPQTMERKGLGWGLAHEDWIVYEHDAPALCNDWLESCDVLLSGLRDIGLFERRGRKGLICWYVSERWFKPWIGFLRLLHPGYFRMAWRFVRLIKSGKVVYLPMGIWAARDMARLVGLFSGDWRCLFRAPNVAFAPTPNGEIAGCPWMRIWGYFVSPSEAPVCRKADSNTHGRALRILWVGRLLALKRVDTLFQAASACLEKFPLALTVIGDGPERARLEKMGCRLFARCPDALDFRHTVPIAKVRELMRTHDVYVLPSNGYEGWGAVVSEALEEGMRVLGTFEAGATATILPKERLFHAGDCKSLARLLETEWKGELPKCGIGEWNAKVAADKIVQTMEGV